MHSNDDASAAWQANDDARSLDTDNGVQEQPQEATATEEEATEAPEAEEAPDTTEHRAYLVEHFRRYDTLAHLLTSLEDARCVVFVDRDRDATEVGSMLGQDELTVTTLLHEGDEEARQTAVAAIQSGEARVLVTTDEALAEAGIDTSDTRFDHVVHTDLPDDEQAYRWRNGLLATDAAETKGASHLFIVPKRERHTTRLFEEAGITLAFAEAPQAARITERRDRERTERFVKSLLETIQGEEGLPLEQADRLLEHFEARDLVAALLWRADRARQRAQREDRGTLRPQPGQDRGRRHEGDRERPQRRFEDSRGERHDSRDRGQRSDGFEGGVRFFVNWGRNQGATPNRLLAAICRRGEVNGSMVGSIAIHPNASTFDVRPDVAESFERLAGRQDERDPQTWIRRDRGPSHGQRDDRGGGGRSYGGHGDRERSYGGRGDRERSYGGRGDRGGRSYDNRGGGGHRPYDRGGSGGDRGGYRGGDSRGYGRGDGRGDRNDGPRRPYRPRQNEGYGGGSGSYQRDGDRGGYRGGNRGGYRDDRGDRGGRGYSRGGGDHRSGGDHRGGGDRRSGGDHRGGDSRGGDYRGGGRRRDVERQGGYRGR